MKILIIKGSEEGEGGESRSGRERRVTKGEAGVSEGRDSGARRILGPSEARGGCGADEQAPCGVPPTRQTSAASRAAHAQSWGGPVPAQGRCWPGRCLPGLLPQTSSPPRPLCRPTHDRSPPGLSWAHAAHGRNGHPVSSDPQETHLADPKLGASGQLSNTFILVIG